ncbi:ParA family protein [Chroococcus sp. FPU101]|uniref:ParA family protein n=1 Tax=Chroococcus sp. FPU101 TaxID=1974212 RepID=UPI001A8F2CCB|nr:ParA family protein [Chroococcus sp. FPU101]GFE72205.1 hypothetical protein CFPU101_48150 [Chroococcus sp. FPU101]
MTRIIALINLKGGVSKSTTAVYLCRHLLGQNLKVALVDADAQTTSSQWIDNLSENIPLKKVYRITEPDPLLDMLPS